MVPTLAAVTKKLELKAAICAKVRVIPDKLNRHHHPPLDPSRLLWCREIIA
jgi:hypothetical protein